MMTKRILVAVDGSDNATKAVEFVGDTIGGSKDFEVTLCCIVEARSGLLEHEHMGVEHPDDEAWLASRKQKVESDVVNPAQQILTGKGVAPNAIHVCTRLVSDAHTDAALAIIEEARTGNFDIVVLGRRGLSMLKEFLLGSVTSKVVHHLEDRAVWIVG